jgi:hypothetical protein
MQPELDLLRENRARRDRRIGVADTLRQVLAARDTDVALLETAMREAATVALRTLFPTLLASATGTEIAALLATALIERGPETLMLRAHPDTLATVAAEIATEQEAGRVTLAACDNMPHGAAEIAWAGGGLTFDPAALLANITSVLALPPLASLSGDSLPPNPEPSKVFP